MALKLHQFQHSLISPEQDSSIYSALQRDRDGVIPNRLNECVISYSGLALTISTGMIFCQGRTVEITEPLVLRIDVSTTGIVILEIDTTISNSFTGTVEEGTYEIINNQVSIDIKYNTNYDSLTKEDIFTNNGIYQMGICSFIANASVITSVTPIDNLYTAFGDSQIDQQNLVYKPDLQIVQNGVTNLGTRLNNLEADTGWVAPPIQTGYAYEGNGIRRIGNVVYFGIYRFYKIDGTAISGNVVIGHLPIKFRPSVIHYINCVTSTYGTGYFQINPNNGYIISGALGGANGFFVPPISYLI